MIGAVILAAGASSRMGRPKMLLPLEGRTLVRRAADAALESEAGQVVVVTGGHRDLVEAELSGLSVDGVFNPDYREGMSTSLRLGLLALRSDAEAAVVVLGDQPLVGTEILDGLIDVYRQSGASIVRARYGGKPGNPVLWGRRWFGDLLEQRGDQGGRQVLETHAPEVAYYDAADERAEMDVDTPAAYESLVRRLQAPDGHAVSHVDHGDEPRHCPLCAGRLAPREVEGRTRPVCERCGAVFWRDPKVAVAVLIPWENGVLLGRRAIDPGRGRWSFPAGYVDRGEVLEEAALREVGEETGLDVEIDGLVGAYSRRGRPLILLAYAGHVVGGGAIPGPEVTELAGFPTDSLPDMAFDHDERIVADWLDLLRRREAR